jgi:hypothetical protein
MPLTRWLERSEKPVGVHGLVMMDFLPIQNIKNGYCINDYAEKSPF